MYDGDGRRVKKMVDASTTTYVYNALGQLVAEYTNTSPTGNGGTSYLTADHLGSTRVVTDSNANLIARHDYLPFGEEIGEPYAGRTKRMGYDVFDSTNQRFSSKERDAETGLDYFGARYYGSTMGRFLSPDEFMGGPVDVFGGGQAPPGPLPYANISDPQSLNKYAYAFNNLLRFIDPDGHKAGDKYATLDEAGVEAANDAQEKTKKDKKHFEYGGRTYRNADGTYSYTKPKRGEEQGETTRSQDPKKDIPKNTENAGGYHSHPGGIAYTKPEEFSPDDRTNQFFESTIAQQQGDPHPIKPEYLGSPTQILRFTPDIQSTSNDSRGTPGDVHRWNPSAQTWTRVPEQSWH